MVYATYEYYTEEFGGNIVSDANTFKSLARKASAYIDQVTFGRIDEGNVNTFPSLPACVCDMVEVICQTEYAGGTGKEVKSESNDGYSVTYVTERKDGETSEEALQRKLFFIAKMYLINTGLLYCGVGL